jgi:hypothetical protein
MLQYSNIPNLLLQEAYMEGAKRGKGEKGGKGRRQRTEDGIK